MGNKDYGRLSDCAKMVFFLCSRGKPYGHKNLYIMSTANIWYRTESSSRLIDFRIEWVALSFLFIINANFLHLIINSVGYIETRRCDRALTPSLSNKYLTNVTAYLINVTALPSNLWPRLWIHFLWCGCCKYKERFRISFNLIIVM